MVAHIKQTKMIMEYFKRCDKMHSEGGTNDTNDDSDDDDDDEHDAPAIPLAVKRPANAAPMQYRSSRRAAATTANTATTSAAAYKPYR